MITTDRHAGLTEGRNQLRKKLAKDVLFGPAKRKSAPPEKALPHTGLIQIFSSSVHRHSGPLRGPRDNIHFVHIDAYESDGSCTPHTCSMPRLTVNCLVT